MADEENGEDQEDAADDADYHRERNFKNALAHDRLRIIQPAASPAVGLLILTRES